MKIRYLIVLFIVSFIFGYGISSIIEDAIQIETYKVEEVK